MTYLTALDQSNDLLYLYSRCNFTDEQKDAYRVAHDCTRDFVHGQPCLSYNPAAWGVYREPIQDYRLVCVMFDEHWPVGMRTVREWIATAKALLLPEVFPNLVDVEITLSRYRDMEHEYAVLLSVLANGKNLSRMERLTLKDDTDPWRAPTGLTILRLLLSRPALKAITMKNFYFDPESTADHLGNETGFSAVQELSFLNCHLPAVITRVLEQPRELRKLKVPACIWYDEPFPHLPLSIATQYASLELLQLYHVVGAEEDIPSPDLPVPSPLEFEKLRHPAFGIDLFEDWGFESCSWVDSLPLTLKQLRVYVSGYRYLGWRTSMMTDMMDKIAAAKSGGKLPGLVEIQFHGAFDRRMIGDETAESDRDIFQEGRWAWLRVVRLVEVGIGNSYIPWK